MKLLIFDISKDIESELFRFGENQGYIIMPRGDPKNIDEGREQYWSILSSDKEIFWISITELKTGQRIMLLGPLRNRKHQFFYNQLVEETLLRGAKTVTNLGEYVKRGEYVRKGPKLNSISMDKK